MSGIDGFLEELAATTGPFLSKLEGLQDFERVLQKPDESPARAQIGQAIVAYQRRAGLLAVAREALLSLKADGYPDRIPIELPPNIHAAVAAQVESMAAAFAEISGEPGEAVAGLVIIE